MPFIMSKVCPKDIIHETKMSQFDIEIMNLLIDLRQCALGKKWQVSRHAIISFINISVALARQRNDRSYDRFHSDDPQPSRPAAQTRQSVEVAVSGIHPRSQAPTVNGLIAPTTQHCR
jgi:hypothetical protein